MYPKTIRLRPQDQVDLEYLTLITGLSEGALIRFLVAQAATFVRRETIAREPALRHDPAWAGGTGALITPADRQAWAHWCAEPTALVCHETVSHE